jgi:hypothetical protein
MICRSRLLAVGMVFVSACAPCADAQMAATAPVATAPAVPPRLKISPRDACRFSIVDGLLAVGTKIEQTAGGGLAPVELTGMPGTAMVMATEGRLQLNYALATTAGREHILVERTANSVRATWHQASQTNARTVLYNQQRDMGPDRLNTTLLQINEYDVQTQQVIKNVTYSAKDFAALRAQQPADVREYLGPLFIQFGWRAALGIDALAREVLEDPKLPAEIAEKARKLVADLDSDQYAVRTAALEELRKLGADVVPALRAMDQAKMTEEQKLTVAEIIVGMKGMPPEQIARLRNNRDFLLDCLYSGDAVVLAMARTRIEAMLGAKIEIDPKADADERAKVIEPLRGK